MSSSEPTVIVTLEGSLTPCVALARGEQITVPLDDTWQRRIDRGFVTIVKWQEIPPAKRTRKPRS